MFQSVQCRQMLPVEEYIQFVETFCQCNENLVRDSLHSVQPHVVYYTTFRRVSFEKSFQSRSDPAASLKFPLPLMTESSLRTWHAKTFKSHEINF